jgi:hypothetical protein
LWFTTIPLFVHLPLGRDAATALAATLRPQPSLGRECDAGNRALHIGETSRYVPVCWRKSIDRWARCIVKEAPRRPSGTWPWSRTQRRATSWPLTATARNCIHRMQDAPARPASALCVSRPSILRRGPPEY